MCHVIKNVKNNDLTPTLFLTRIGVAFLFGRLRLASGGALVLWTCLWMGVSFYLGGVNRP